MPLVSENISPPDFDLFIVGGGINGCGIARDAAGRGLMVALAEMGDLAQATSSSSTKLFHGGLRYLEYFEIGLVRKALAEREVLLGAMPHISRPMRFVLPYHEDMRFDGDTPTSRLLSLIMPWMRGRRPAWLIRLGLLLYDHLGGRKILPATSTLDLASDAAGLPLKDKFRHAYEYSDCQVDDARLVVLNARDAAQRGARIMTRTKVTGAEREADHWRITVEKAGRARVIRARAIVNAGGPWVEALVRDVAHLRPKAHIRLVRGSHIVTRRLFDHDRAYFFQGTDGRIIFAIPYEEDFTLIGTTDQDHQGSPSEAICSDAERDYLCAFASQYFKRPVTAADVVWSYAGVRPLYDDGASSASAATRDYVLTLNTEGAPILNVFGGKITTYRRLAEAALARIGPLVGGTKGNWTAGVPLPGGDFPVDGVAALGHELAARYPFLDGFTLRRLIRSYGTEAWEVLGDAGTAGDLGRSFGAGLTEAETRWLMRKEYAKVADDVIWRRTKLGLRMTEAEIAALDTWMAAQRGDS
ncbi:MAG: glycerol-3-phosphate dehydrogenase [Rhodobacteraceae bacterium]|nr:glycerol-3-phosphate dehydrogenase [Paracoccaceae bacterium]MCP5342506.1 glycerol-3-phosphate dehydrogenase [Paracoccaceae bacterium]